MHRSMAVTAFFTLSKYLITPLTTYDNTQSLPRQNRTCPVFRSSKSKAYAGSLFYAHPKKN